MLAPAVASLQGGDPSPARTHDDIRLALVECFLGSVESRLEVLAVQGRLDDLVVMGAEVRRLHSPDHRVAAVEVQKFMGPTLRLMLITSLGD
jgi:hypothetical protein